MYQHQPPPFPAASSDWMMAYADMEPSNMDVLLLGDEPDLNMTEFQSVHGLENTTAFITATAAPTIQAVAMPLAQHGFYWTPSPAEDMYVDSDTGKNTGFPPSPSSLPPPTLFEAIRSSSEAIHDPASPPMVKLLNGQTLRVCASAAVMRDLERPDVSDIKKAQRQVEEQLQMHGIVRRKQEPIVTTAASTYPQQPHFLTSCAPAEFDPYEGSLLGFCGTTNMDCLAMPDLSAQDGQTEALCEDGTMTARTSDGGRRKTTQAAMLESFVTHRNLGMLNLNIGGNDGIDSDLDNGLDSGPDSGLGGTLDGFNGFNPTGNHGILENFTTDRLIDSPVKQCGYENSNTSTTQAGQCSSHSPIIPVSDSSVSDPASNLPVSSSPPAGSSDIDSLDREEHKTMLFHTLVHSYWKTHGLDSCATAMEEARVPILTAECLHRVGVFDGRATASTMVMWWFRLFCELFGLDKSDKVLIEQYAWNSPKRGPMPGKLDAYPITHSARHEQSAANTTNETSPGYKQKRLPDEYEAVSYRTQRSKPFVAKYPRVLVPIAPAPAPPAISTPAPAPSPVPAPAPTPELVQKSAVGRISPASTPQNSGPSDYIARETRDAVLMPPPQRPREIAVTAAVVETTPKQTPTVTNPYWSHENDMSRARQTHPTDQGQQDLMHAGQRKQKQPQSSLPRPAYNATNMSYNDISAVDCLSMRFMLLERKNKQIVREAGERDNQIQVEQQQRQRQTKHQ